MCLYDQSSASGVSVINADSYYGNNTFNGGAQMNDRVYYINNQSTLTKNFCRGLDYYTKNVTVTGGVQAFGAFFAQSAGVSSHRGNACR